LLSSPNAQKLKIKEAHKRIMLINHPDRGGSPYIASKINEGILKRRYLIKILNRFYFLIILTAKDIMDTKKAF
jgi:hypothetical protein